MKPKIQLAMNAIKKHLKSYVFAFRGIGLALRLEVNMTLHLIATLVIVGTNYILNVDRADWLFTLMLIGVVWMAEIFNTAIEKLADRVTQNNDDLIRQAKDLAAGAVLVICIVAVVCAVIIYYPYYFPNVNT
jgi:diacylglycerol kinase